MLRITKKLIKNAFPQLWIEAALKVRKGHFERELYLVPLFCSKRHMAVDVGANQGVYTYVMSKYAGKVISFEPNSLLLKSLKKVAGCNVMVKSEALSNEPGVTVLRIDPSNPRRVLVDR